MRDPKRIKKILNLLEKLWEKYPDLRFGQLIENLYRNSDTIDKFYVEDDEWERILHDSLES